MEDIMNAHNWEINKQSFLEIPGTEYLLSVIPEYTYFTRDENNRLVRSKIAQGIKFNCCVVKVYNTEYGRIYHNEMLLDITTEDEFYDFMLGVQKEFGTKRYHNGGEQELR